LQPSNPMVVIRQIKASSFLIMGISCWCIEP
jgi:hypothetical protein